MYLDEARRNQQSPKGGQNHYYMSNECKQKQKNDSDDFQPVIFSYLFGKKN